MNKRGLAAALVLASVAIGMVSILVLSTLTATVALPLTNEGMIKKAKVLPEVKAFQEKYPNYSISAGNSTSSNADGYVNYHIGSWAYRDKTILGPQRFDNTLELTVLFNRTSGEIVEVSLDCAANLYREEFGRSLSEPDPDKSFHFTSADKNILGYIQQGEDERCF